MTPSLKNTTLVAIASSAITSLVVSALFLSIIAPVGSRATVPTPITSSNPLMTGNPDIPATVKRSEPSVVSVIISKEVPVVERYYNQNSNDPFGNFFNMPIPRYRQNGTQQQEVGGGTAFFVTADGLLMTNKHVVDDPNAKYTVFLNDGRKLEAKVVAIDPTNDIALIKVQGNNFPALALGKQTMLGQPVIAIGNALGEYRNTVSVGVISGLGRSITAGSQATGQVEQLSRILQTDAAINEGNSGGPLLDVDGNVIGMNTAVASDAQNIGFAIPAADLRRVLESYRKNGRIVRPYLGVRYAPVTPDMQKKYQLQYDYGAIVSAGDPGELAVIPDSPADKAGIQPNDIILEADGQKLDENTSLSSIIQGKLPGDGLTLKVSHRGQVKTVTVKLDEWKDTSSSSQ